MRALPSLCGMVALMVSLAWAAVLPNQEYNDVATSFPLPLLNTVPAAVAPDTEVTFRVRVNDHVAVASTKNGVLTGLWAWATGMSGRFDGLDVTKAGPIVGLFAGPGNETNVTVVVASTTIVVVRANLDTGKLEEVWSLPVPKEGRVSAAWALDTVEEGSLQLVLSATSAAQEVLALRLDLTTAGVAKHQGTFVQLASFAAAAVSRDVAGEMMWCDAGPLVQQRAVAVCVVLLTDGRVAAVRVGSSAHALPVSQYVTVTQNLGLGTFGAATQQKPTVGWPQVGSGWGCDGFTVLQTRGDAVVPALAMVQVQGWNETTGAPMLVVGPAVAATNATTFAAPVCGTPSSASRTTLGVVAVNQTHVTLFTTTPSLDEATSSALPSNMNQATLGRPVVAVDARLLLSSANNGTVTVLLGQSAIPALGRAVTAVNGSLDRLVFSSGDEPSSGSWFDVAVNTYFGEDGNVDILFRSPRFTTATVVEAGSGNWVVKTGLWGATSAQAVVDAATGRALATYGTEPLLEPVMLGAALPEGSSSAPPAGVVAAAVGLDGSWTILAADARVQVSAVSNGTLLASGVDTTSGRVYRVLGFNGSSVLSVSEPGSVVPNGTPLATLKVSAGFNLNMQVFPASQRVVLYGFFAESFDNYAQSYLAVVSTASSATKSRIIGESLTPMTAMPLGFTTPYLITYPRADGETVLVVEKFPGEPTTVALYGTAKLQVVKSAQYVFPDQTCETSLALAGEQAGNVLVSCQTAVTAISMTTGEVVFQVDGTINGAAWVAPSATGAVAAISMGSQMRMVNLKGATVHQTIKLPQVTPVGVVLSDGNGFVYDFAMLNTGPRATDPLRLYLLRFNVTHPGAAVAAVELGHYLGVVPQTSFVNTVENIAVVGVFTSFSFNPQVSALLGVDLVTGSVRWSNTEATATFLDVSPTNSNLVWAQLESGQTSNVAASDIFYGLQLWALEGCGRIERGADAGYFVRCAGLEDAGLGSYSGGPTVTAQRPTGFRSGSTTPFLSTQYPVPEQPAQPTPAPSSSDDGSWTKPVAAVAVCLVVAAAIVVIYLRRRAARANRANPYVSASGDVPIMGQAIDTTGAGYNYDAAVNQDSKV